jgi:hypothetical protein
MAASLMKALELATNQVTHFYSDKKNTEEIINLIDMLSPLQIRLVGK